MATIKSVTVLVPNGRRQTVKVTLNTTILEVLEEVCQKHGYNADNYDLKHFNRILDCNTIMRMVGLSNNAQLEMVPCTKARSSSIVTIGVQLENGERIMNEFIPTTTLIDILQHMCLNQDLERTVLIYMHREIRGSEALKKTTLKSLGLNNGKAILRLILRDMVISTEKPDTDTTTSRSIKNLESSDTTSTNTECPASLESTCKRLSDSKTELQKETQVPENLATCSSIKEILSKKPTELDKANEISVTAKNKLAPLMDNSAEITTKLCSNYETYITKKIEFLDQRNCIIFNRAMIEPLPREEIPDDFYDLNVEDAKVLLRDNKRRREELEEAPLLTCAQRQLNQDTQMLNYLSKYQYTIIRIEFPDQFVLQGRFRPLETVQTVKNFVKDYLEDADSNFMIYTTPPKHILNSEARLIDENLVPSAIIHYSGSSSLKSEVKNKIIDPKDIQMQTIKDRISISEDKIINKETETVDTANNKSNQKVLANESLNKNKIPKWFKTHK